MTKTDFLKMKVRKKQDEVIIHKFVVEVENREKESYAKEMLAFLKGGNVR